MGSVGLTNFTKSIEKILDQYQKDVSEALEPGLDEAQEYLIDQLKAASPTVEGDYKNHWKAGESGKGYRRVINDKTVKWNGKQQHLAGILEYSTHHGKHSPHIEKTKRASRKKIMKILKESIKNGA